MAQQVALIYTGINGFLDDLAVSDVKQYCASLLSYLETSSNSYINLVTSTNQFTEEAENALKDAITASKEVFVK